MTPSPVRTGTSRGRSSRLWYARSFVAQDSMFGYNAMSVNMIPGMITPGIRMFQLIVWLKMCVSQLGIMRSEPSRNRMYQSGWEPADTCAGLYGPYNHT